MPRIPIALKLALSISVLVILGIALLTVVLLNNQSRLVSAHSYDYSTLITEQLANNAVEPLFTDETYQLQALTKKIAANERILGAGIFDLDGLLVANDGMLPDRDELLFDKPYQELQMSVPDDRKRPRVETLSIHIEPIRFKGVTAGYAVASYSQAALLRSSQKSLVWVAGISGSLLLAICALIYLLSRRLTGPLHQLVAASNNIRNGKFSPITTQRQDEFGQLINAINEMGTGLNRKNQLEDLMEQMLTKGVASEVIDQLDTIRDGGQQVNATVLFADIVGFTHISEQLSPREVSELLNEYFNHLEACAKAYFGTIDKFIGDCAMVVFGAPKEDPQHEFHAVACAVLMQKLINRLNQKRLDDGEFAVELRIGVNSGQMLAGLLGSNNRLEYTVVGDSVNLASRLSNEARSGQIIIEEGLYERVSQHKTLQVEPQRQIRVRGKAEPITIYNVLDVDQINPFVMENLIQDVLSMQRAA
ncbi:MAG: adenylate/guanylate cyclase domain-containing protein [Pseudomonadota bacterium]